MTRPQSGGNRKSLYIVGGVLAVVVLGVISYFFFQKDGSTPTIGASDIPTKVQGVVVTAGKAAPVTVDVYEDFLCPICGRFESNFKGDMAKAISAGKIQVKYHPTAILNKLSNPAGYSTRAANAALCAADAGKFSDYHDKLFAEQPAENSPGLTNAELIAKGQEVGVAGSFAQCVNAGKYNKQIDAATAAAVKDTSLRQPGGKGFGTPTVLVNGKWVDWRDGAWLTGIG
jgi:protein-disulfide isomerase